LTVSLTSFEGILLKERPFIRRDP